MKLAFAFFLSLTASVAMAAIENTNSTSLSGVSTGALEASSKSEALQTQSIYYSLPRKDMTYLELGAFNQGQDFRTEATGTDRLNNQAFFFNHSRGLTEELALDFNVNYFLRDNNTNYGSTGIGQASLGGRSHFDAMELNWVYGAYLTYLPDGQYLNDGDKFAVTGKIGFEETVDIAKWGLEAQLSTQNTQLFDQTAMFIGFFEIPFVNKVNVGISGGADLARAGNLNTDHNNFARAYAQYAFDKVSAVQANLKQVNQKEDGNSLSETEVGLALNRVF